MISGSMNSIIAQRTQFFGMLRCIGASRQQIIRFVRLEALNWCKTAVPIGVVFGTIISWIICATLHYGIGGEFSTTPVFQISPVGLMESGRRERNTLRKNRSGMKSARPLMQHWQENRKTSGN